jgi:hypothetical protein
MRRSAFIGFESESALLFIGARFQRKTVHLIAGGASANGGARRLV